MVSEDIVLRVASAYGLNLVICRSFLNLVENRIFVNDEVLGLYFKLDDDTLELLKYGLIDITDGKEVMRLFSMDGDNIHFVSAVSTDRGLFALRKIDCKSVSWFTPNLDKFVYFKRR
nr:MAG: hypothetical protein [Microviridae sp.]